MGNRRLPVDTRSQLTDAYLLLAELSETKRNPEAEHDASELQSPVPQARVCEHGANGGGGKNLSRWAKRMRALVMYQRIASDYPNSFNAPMALLSQVVHSGKPRSQRRRPPYL